MLKNISRKNNKGFALLFSVLISSLLLTIGLSIFSIALKELAISTATRQSVHAFYAADSGREYALYQDLILGDILDDNFDFANPTQGPVTYDIPLNAQTGEVNLVDDPKGPNYYVKITKSWSDATHSKINTDIVSYGRDSIGGDRVERAIFQSY
jgi:hypothetical protein